MAKTSNSIAKRLPALLLGGGLLGLLASFTLAVEKVEILKNPAFEPSCNINPILSCGSVMITSQAEAFGFPNPYLGILGFSAVATVGAALLAGAKFKRWFWISFNIGLLLALIFVHWLIFQTLYRINALCPYCMVVWTVTIPIFWYTTLYCLSEKIIKTPQSLKSIVSFAQKHHGDILILWYLAIIGLILNRFWYYWSTLI